MLYLNLTTTGFRNRLANVLLNPAISLKTKNILLSGMWLYVNNITVMNDDHLKWLDLLQELLPVSTSVIDVRNYNCLILHDNYNIWFSKTKLGVGWIKYDASKLLLNNTTQYIANVLGLESYLHPK